ncbi:GAF domain-containing protein [Frondihabitans cladoniiphilus]
MSGPLLLTRPSDATRAHASGVNPDRVLLFGNGVANGWGARTQTQALPGELAQALTERTGRGTDVDVVAGVDWTIENAAEVIAGRDLTGYDAIILLIGVSDAFQLLPEQRWTAGLVQVLSELLKRTSPSTGITVMGIQPISTIGVFDTEPGGLADRWAERLNQVSWQVCEGRARVHYVDPPAANLIREPVSQAGAEATSLDHFHSWAFVQAAHLAPYLDAQSGVEHPARVSRNTSQSRQRRLDALWKTHLLEGPPEPRFDAIVRRAQQVFGADGAAFTVIDANRQFNKAVAGFDITEVPLERSFCKTTITTSQPFVVGDAETDTRLIEHETGELGARFYAGYPVEAPDGTRIGALCVFGGQPRDPDSVDIVALRDFALAIQDELALTVAGRTHEESRDPSIPFAEGRPASPRSSVSV